MKCDIFTSWTKEEDSIRWVGTPEQFDEWRKQWKKEIPKCEDFYCCHELMSCGIHHACGDCSIYTTMARGTGDICTNVDCIDCAQKYRCKYGHQSREQNEKEKLKFIEYPVCDTCRFRNENNKRCSGMDKVHERGEDSCSAWRLWMDGDA